MKRFRFVFAALTACAVAWIAASAAQAARVKESTYRGWKSLALDNGLVELQIVPDLGGRVMQYTLGDFEYLWVNERLAGKQPPPSGVGPEGGWLNWGGDKLWPAPQGWSGPEQWPGPPGPPPNPEGLPHKAKVLKAEGKEAAVELTGPKDQYAGIQFSRVIRIFDGSTRVSIDSTMANIDTQPRRWGIWEVTQHNAARPDGSMKATLRAYCPINPESMYPRGYNVLFGLVNNPTFSADREKGLVKFHYKRMVGKIGVDCSAGWLAVVDGAAGKAFVTRFQYYPDKAYPDGASVEFWSQGKGTIITGDTIAEMSDDVAENPHLVESEVLSPFAELQPAESTSFHVDWYACNIGGDYPILDCTNVGVTCKPLRAMLVHTHARGKIFSLSGRFGVFVDGKIGLAFLDAKGKELTRIVTEKRESPAEAIDLPSWRKPIPAKDVPAGASSVLLFVTDAEGRVLGELARAAIAVATE